MSALDANSQITKLARSLGLNGLDGPVSQITDYCMRRIEEMTKDVTIISLDQLEETVALKLNLVFEEICARGYRARRAKIRRQAERPSVREHSEPFQRRHLRHHIPSQKGVAF